MTRARGVLRALSALPGAVIAVLPSAHCPFCLGAYGALVSSVGLGCLIKENVLGPLIAAFLLLGVATVGWSTRSHRHPGPLIATIIGSLAIAVGRLHWTIPILVYVGGAIVLAASFWNLWLKRRQPQPLVEIRLGRKGEAP